ncbi:RNA polymerase sigma factor [Paenibacillus sediminis]|uniref:RNA polymerase sigma factor n=1 Tax=Paenibacillus sediminis TaxID=664909 RepID=A0ABS4H141_9BACL|nr:RNA polymerase sigma factor [Paenibacillus sediminis]MBP1935992.1 RNA polymerase sigma-70 factor (ECF subfamily) [Paenibacillus sediminis]
MHNRLQLLLAAGFNDLSEALQEEVYYEYYEYVYGIILYIVKDHAATEDIIQDAFIKIIQNKPVFDNEVKLRAWLKVVTKNTAINYLRKNKKHRNQLDSDSVFINVEPMTQAAASVENAVETKLMEQSILNHLSNMKADYRSLIEFRWKQGLSYKEIAELLDTTEEIVKQRLFRARESIKKMLHREWGVTDEKRKIR